MGDVGVMTELGRDWRFFWCRNLFVWEEELLLSLMEDLEGMIWSSNDDVWRWSLEDTRFFTVKSAYEKLEGLAVREEVWDVEEERVFHNL